jgi:hypothetical protein
MGFFRKNIIEEDRESSVKGLGHVETLFRLFKIIGEDESLYDLICRPFKEVRSATNKFIKLQKRGSDLEPNFLAVIMLINLSGTFRFLAIESKSAMGKTNALKMRDEINQLVISEANPFLISFFKWDLDRRKWKNEKDKLKFLKKTIQGIDNELKGLRKDLIKKYVDLLLRYLIHHWGNYIANTSKDDFEQYGLKMEESADSLNKLRAFVESDQLPDIIGEDLERMILLYYRPIAQQIEEGLSVTGGRFDYLVATFIEAQVDYKNIVQGMVDSLSNKKINNLRQALLATDIPKFISLIHSIFASVPHQLLKSTNESYYHINLHVMLQAIGCNILSEVSTNKGRIDSVIEFDNIIYIVEYKLDGADSAIDQIEKHRYYERYANSGKKILLLGLSFDIIDRNIRETYVLKELR